MGGSLTIRELITKLGFDVEDEKLKAFERNMAHAKTIALGLTGAVAAGAIALFGITKSAADAGEEIRSNAELTGLSVEQFQSYALAAKQAEVSNEEFTTSLRFLTRNIGDAMAQAGGPAAKAFSKLGIPLKDAQGQTRKTGDILHDLVDRFSKIPDPATRASIAMDLFGRGGARMGRFLAGGSAQVEKAAKIIEAFGFTEEQTRQADEAGDAFGLIFEILKGIKNVAGIALFPVMKKVSETFTDWAVANRDVIKTRIVGFVTMLAKLLGFLFDKLMAIVRIAVQFVRMLGGMENAVKLFGLALVSLFAANVILGIFNLIKGLRALKLEILLTELAAFALPIAIAAIIFALGLLLEDIYAFVKGGDSFIGTFDAFLQKMAETSKVAAFFNGVLEVIAGFWTTLIGLFTGNGPLIVEGLRAMFGDLLNVAKDGALRILESIKQFAIKIKDAIAGMIPEPLRRAGMFLGGVLAGPLGMGGQPASMGGPMAPIPGLGQAALAGFPGGGFHGTEQVVRPSVTNQSTSTKSVANFQISVPAQPGAAAGDVGATRQVVREVMDETLRRHFQHVKQNNPEAD